MIGKAQIMMKRTTILWVLIATLLTPTLATARITKVQITTTESPTFGGYSWPDVGSCTSILRCAVKHNGEM